MKSTAYYVPSKGKLIVRGHTEVRHFLLPNGLAYFAVNEYDSVLCQEDRFSLTHKGRVLLGKRWPDYETWDHWSYRPYTHDTLLKKYNRHFFSNVVKL